MAPKTLSLPQATPSAEGFCHERGLTAIPTNAYTGDMHVHAKSDAPKSGIQSILKFSLGLTLLYILATAWFGLRAHSLALLSEAGHNLSDFLALGLSFVAVYLQGRPATADKTFGYQRAGVLAAFVNALTLIVLAGWIAIAAIHRFADPVTVQPRLMMVVAAAGVLMNGAIATLLWKFSADVILGGLSILFTGFQWIAPLLSLIIAAMILWSSIGIVRETLHILLEGTPRNLNLADIRTAMEKVPGVVNVHDLHVWSLGSQSHALASHMQVIEMDLGESEALLERVNHQLRDHFGINHTTIQLEITDCPTVDGCCSPPEPEVIDGHSHHSHGPGGHDHSHSHAH